MERHKSYNTVFISTFIDRKNIDHLIRTALDNNQTLSILFIIVNQTKSELILPSSTHIDFLQINTERLSLSKARNIGINYLLKNEINFEHIMFPDDDTTFSNVFFDRYKDYINSDENYLIDVYCFRSSNLFKPVKYVEGEFLNRRNFEAAMSVNMIINYKTFVQVGIFDERLGVGAKYGAGEDADYYIRACDFSHHRFIYIKTLFNFHPSSSNKFSKMKLKQIINKYTTYGNGAIFMLCKHKMYFEAFKICFRAIGGVIVALCKLNFKLFIAYGFAFFSRLSMFVKCIIYSKRLFKHA
tara:strand:+ start:22572 stop:23465 length:894 start_codon:yes stop_codon:yes gene_type:complete